MKTITNDRVRIHEIETLANDWNLLRKYTLDYHRRDGTWQQLHREACHRGDSVVALPYCPSHGTVILTCQFRLPVFVGGQDHGMLIEAPGGLLDDQTPNEAVRREIEEEIGVRVEHVEPILEAYMSPTLVTGRVHFFVAQFSPDNCISSGGGLRCEGEDIEVYELPFNEAFDMVMRREITDGKTILLLYYAKLNQLLGKGELT